MAVSGMKPPLVVKPVWTDGREGSHGLAVVHDMPSLSSLLSGAASTGVKPPVVIQEFVDHGGVLFKVGCCRSVDEVMVRARFFARHGSAPHDNEASMMCSGVCAGRAHSRVQADVIG